MPSQAAASAGHSGSHRADATGRGRLRNTATHNHIGHGPANRKELMWLSLGGVMVYIEKVTTGYAFAHWGGDYWVFLIKNSEASTTVYQVNGMTGAITSTTPTTGRVIVGAGVPTCAPVVIE